MKTTSIRQKLSIQALPKFIRDIPDFPKKGILFRDITPLLKDAKAFRFAVRELADRFRGMKIDQVLGIESRGFILGPAIAIELGVGFVPIRKKGKLPAQTSRVTYQLEYGEDSLEIHTDALQKGSQVVIIDDLLATGGTGDAAVRLAEQLGANVLGLGFLIELKAFKGRERLRNYPVHSLISYL